MPVMRCMIINKVHTTSAVDRRPGTLVVHYYCYFVLYKDSALVPAFTGTHAPGRAGQHFDLFDSIFDREHKNRYHTTHSLRVYNVK